ncbi:MAG: acetate--CoA ligase family protein [Candidatus Gracilibacteria bacterium]|nr:acetate--CoA ligase family protein [Candidatus Gracilibacteria bacterium]
MIGFKKIESVVVIGASEDTRKIGNILLAKNQDFSGRVYGVNPRGGNAYGKDFFPNISALPEVPDIAIFAIPEAFIYDSLEEAGAFGIQKAIIITAGFKEVGNKEGEKRLQEIALKYGIRILGPNCLGYGDTAKGLNLSFGGNFFESGNIGIISQSGAMAVAITDVLSERRLGFSAFFSLGNKADIDESDILEELADDTHTEVIAVYLESIARGKVFLEMLKKVTPKKPVIVMIGGVSDHGKKATASHTGSLSGDRVMYEAAIREGGAMLTYSLAEFFDLLQIFSRAARRDIVGNPYIITNAGGPGVLATDQSEFHHLELATITPDEDVKLRVNMPTMMSTKNPIDIIGDADSERVAQILTNIVMVRPSADILFLFTVQATTDIDAIAEKIVEFSRENPSYHIFIGLIGGETILRAREKFAQAGIFVTLSTESLIGSYAKLANQRSVNQKQPSEIATIPHGEKKESLLLDQNQTEELFQSYSIASTNTREYTTLEEILDHTTKNTGPFVMKMAGKRIIHKTEIGGIVGPVSSREEVTTVYETLQKNGEIYCKNGEMEGVAIGKFLTPSPKLELFFGAKRDANFGETFIVGAGGIFLTILDDTRLHIGQWTREEIADILASLRSYPLMTGYRGQQLADIDGLIVLLENLSRLFFEHPEIREIDINPIIFNDGKPYVADGKLYID